MLEIITHGPNAHELRRDGVRVAVVDDIADARKLAAVDELLTGCQEAREKITGVEDVFDGLAQMLDQAIALVKGK